MPKTSKLIPSRSSRKKVIDTYNKAMIVRIYDLIKERETNQSELADVSGVPVARLNMFLKAKCSLRLDEIAALAWALNEDL